MAEDFVSPRGNAPAIKAVVGDFVIPCLSRNGFTKLLLEDWHNQHLSQYRLPPKISYSVNGQIVAEVNRNAQMKAVFSRADYLDPDGMWLVFASRVICRVPLPERVATTDFFHDAAKVAERNGLSFYVLGSTSENNIAVRKKLRRQYPGLSVVGGHHGYFLPSEEEAVIDAIAAARPDVLWIGMGYPRQERFAERVRDRLIGVTWIKTCGGLFEHILEAQPRAPSVIQQLGFEWLHRLIREPRRLAWRYIKTNPLAFWDLATRTRRLPLGD